MRFAHLEGRGDFLEMPAGIFGLLLPAVVADDTVFLEDGFGGGFALHFVSVFGFV